MSIIIKYVKTLYKGHIFQSIAITFIGAILNILVTHLNNGMPVIDMDTYSLTGKTLVMMTSQTKLPFLGDIIPYGIGYFSIGDILIILGDILFVYFGVRLIISLMRQRRQLKCTSRTELH